MVAPTYNPSRRRSPALPHHAGGRSAVHPIRPTPGPHGPPRRLPERRSSPRIKELGSGWPEFPGVSPTRTGRKTGRVRRPVFRRGLSRVGVGRGPHGGLFGAVPESRSRGRGTPPPPPGPAPGDLCRPEKRTYDDRLSPRSGRFGPGRGMSQIDPGCVKTASECSRRDFLWILKNPTSIKSRAYQTTPSNNRPTTPRIVVFAGVFTQPGPNSDIGPDWMGTAGIGH